MRYLCVHCDHRFDHEGEGKPRCPKCMRVHGVEAMETPTKPGAAGTARPPWLWVAGAVVVVAALGGAYWYWAHRAPDSVSGPAPTRPLEPSELLGHLRRLQVDARELTSMLEASEALEQFGAGATAGKSAPVARARGVVDALRARARRNAFVPWSLTEPRDTPVRTAARAYELVQRDGGRAKLYPLEVVAVAVAALRSAGVDAMAAEVWSFAGDRAPPDPSGHFGYFVVAVWDAEVGQGTPTLLDPYGGRTVDSAGAQHRVLTDVEVVAAALNLRAIHRLVRDNEPTRAFEESQSAVKLDPRSPSARGVRGAILVASGGLAVAMDEFEAAAQIRGDAPRRNNLAAMLLARRDYDGAAREVAAALEQARDFAAAHGTLAAVHMAQRDMGDARLELETAQRLDPDLATLPMLWANYHLADGDVDSAITYGREAVRRRPNDAQVHLMLGQIFRQAGRYADMRREARAALEAAPENQRQAVRETIRQILGPTAFEDPDEGPAAEGGDEAGAEGGEAAGEGTAALGGPDEGSPGFQLGGGSRLLGDEAPGTGGSGLLRGGDTSKLRLGEPGSGLHLNLNE